MLYFNNEVGNGKCEPSKTMPKAVSAYARGTVGRFLERHIPSGRKVSALRKVVHTCFLPRNDESDFRTRCIIGLQEYLELDFGDMREEYEIDLDVIHGGNKPLFYDVNLDGYSAFDLDRVSGRDCVDALLWLYAQKVKAENTEDRFDAKATALITTLVLDRELTMEECALVCSAVTLCNYLATRKRDGGSDILRPLIIADNNYKIDRLVPVHLALFFMNGKPEDIESFRNTRL